MPNDVQIIEPSKEVDTLDFLNDELDKEQVDQQDKSVPAKVEEEEKEKSEELDIEDKEPEIKEDEINFDAPLKRSEILKAFPELFKKFPEIEKSIYRCEKYEEIFPTLKDANDARERVETLENAEAALFSGELNDILKSVKENNEESFKRIVDNFLPTIEKLDKASYLHIIGNVGKFFIASIGNEANRFGKDTDQGKSLLLGATVLHQFLFGHTNWTPPTKLAKEITEDDKKVSQREQDLIKQRFSEVQSDLVERADNSITATIRKYIDPKESMSSYVRDKAVEDCKKMLEKAILADEPFKNKLDRLWAGVIESDFSRQSQEAVKTAYFNKAKTLLGEIIKKVRNDALSGSNTRVREARKEEPEEKSSGKSAAPKRGQSEEKPSRRESTLDFLNRTLG